MAALRGKDLYIGQSGSGQIILVRPGTVTRVSSDEARRHPLGSNLAVQMRFRHLQLQKGDLLVLTTAEPPLWSDPSLSGLSDLGLSQAVDRLVAASGRDLTGMLIRIPHKDDGRQPLAAPAPSVSTQTPEAQVGGPIALVKNGDKITIDAEANTITVDVSDDEMAKRVIEWVPPGYKAIRGTLYKYIKNVKSASEGCVTDE